ncbi:MAG: hypothetical protein ABI635_09925, partial [Actinomycetota bacterium]
LILTVRCPFAGPAPDEPFLAQDARLDIDTRHRDARREAGQAKPEIKGETRHQYQFPLNINPHSTPYGAFGPHL